MEVPTTLVNACPSQTAGIPGFLITQLLQYLLVAQCDLGNPNDYPNDYGDSLVDLESFDFIIVGAGKYIRITFRPKRREN